MSLDVRREERVIRLNGDPSFLRRRKNPRYGSFSVN